MRSLLYPLLAIVSLTAACSSVNPYYDASKKHYRPDGFNNNHINSWRKDQPNFLKWQWDKLTNPLLAQDASRVKVVTPNLAYIKANRHDAAVT